MLSTSIKKFCWDFYWKCYSLSCVWLLVTYQVPLSMEFSRQDGQWKQEASKSKPGYIQEEQKKQETLKPWPVQPQKEQEPKKQTPKSWTPSVQSDQDITKSWTSPTCEEQDSRHPETPKSWENNVESQKHPLTPQSQISPKSWGVAAASLIPNDQLLPRKFNTEPKDVSWFVSVCSCHCRHK